MMKLMRLGILTVHIIILSGCCMRLPDWSRTSTTWYQGIRAPNWYTQSCPFIRSVWIYNALETAGSFHALLLHNDIRALYARIYGYRRGWNENSVCAMQQQEIIAHHSDVLEFLVLSIVSMPLGRPESEWCVSLCIDDIVYPVHITPVELVPEYQILFGHTLTTYKQPYLVQVEVPIVTALSAATISLRFASTRKEAYLTWCIRDLNNPSSCGFETDINREIR